MKFSGITNDLKDPSVETFQSAALPILKQFGVPSEGLMLKIESRGVPPLGGGEVVLSLPMIQNLNVKSFTLQIRSLLLTVIDHFFFF